MRILRQNEEIDEDSGPFISVRLLNAKGTPCPWIARDLEGASSRPERWNYEAAVAYVRRRSSCAVYEVRGCIVKQIYPPKAK